MILIDFVDQLPNKLNNSFTTRFIRALLSWLSQMPLRLLTCHHAIGGLLVAVVTGGDWVM